MNLSSEQTLNKMDPLRVKKGKLSCRDKDEAWELIYQWVKTDCITRPEFRELSNYLIAIWSL